MTKKPAIVLAWLILVVAVAFTSPSSFGNTQEAAAQLDETLTVIIETVFPPTSTEPPPPTDTPPPPPTNTEPPPPTSTPIPPPTSTFTSVPPTATNTRVPTRTPIPNPTTPVPATSTPIVRTPTRIPINTPIVPTRTIVGPGTSTPTPFFGFPTATPTAFGQPPSETPSTTAIPSQTATPTASPVMVTVTPFADALVAEEEPEQNFGDASRLRVEGGSKPRVETYVMFQVNDISDPIEGATLRLYPTTGSNAGFSVYAADSAWSEADITWATRPTRIGEPIGEVDEVEAETWVEVDVSDVVDSNGVYTFLIVTDSADGTNMSSTQGANKPELVLTLQSPDATATPTFTPAPPTSTPPPPTAVAATTLSASSPTPEQTSPTRVPSNTPTSPAATDSPTVPAATDTPEPSPTATATSEPTSTPTPQPTPLSTIDPNAMIFSPAADARVDESDPEATGGTRKQLRVDGDDGATVESYLVFRVRGVSGTVTNATLRIYSLMDSSQGPEVYAASADWTEGDITWANRPARTSDAVDVVGPVVAETWIEFDVTAIVDGEGVYSFLLATDSTDGMNMSSRESESNRPFLAISVEDSNALSADSGPPSPVATWTPVVENAVARPDD